MAAPATRCMPTCFLFLVTVEPDAAASVARAAIWGCGAWTAAAGTSDGSMPSVPVGAGTETSKTVELASDAVAREREEAGAKMSLPPSAGWDIGCPYVRPFGQILFSSTRGPWFFLQFSVVYGHWSTLKTEQETINISYYMILDVIRARLEML
jgi:hypothetical protein